MAENENILKYVAAIGSTRFNEFDVASVEFIRCGERTSSPLTAQLTEEATEKFVEWDRK